MSRLSSVLATVAFAALAILLGAKPAAAASTCPNVYMLESSNGRDYVVVFSAKTAQRASFDITLFGKARAYSLTLNDVEIDRPTTVAYAPYRSAPTLLQNPDDAPLLGDSVDARVGPSAVKCASDRSSIASVADVTQPPYRRSPEAAATLHEIVIETNALTTVVTPERRPDVAVPQCAEPFTDAHTVHLVTPTYPLIAANAGVTGSVEVKVTLDESGNVTDANVFKSSGNAALDEAGMKAARATTYAPESFLCRPSGGAYIFRADFAGRTR